MLQNEGEKPRYKDVLLRGGSKKHLFAFPSSLGKGIVGCGLNGVLKHMVTSQSLEHGHITSFGERVFVDVTKSRILR